MPIVSAAGGQQVARRVCGVLAPSMTLRPECQKDGSSHPFVSDAVGTVVLQLLDGAGVGM